MIDLELKRLRFIDLDKLDFADPLDAGVREGMEYMKTRAQQYVRVRTRKLQGNIRIEKKTNLVYRLVTDLDYSLPNEYGTYKMAAQPYMRPAARDAKLRLGMICKSHVSGAMR